MATHTAMGLTVYRVEERNPGTDSWDVLGYALETQHDDAAKRYVPVDVIREADNFAVVYLFSSLAAADAFRAGLFAAGEDPILSATGITSLGCPGVIREIEEPEAYGDLLDNESEYGKIVVQDHRESALEVQAWDAPRYGGDGNPEGSVYTMSITDERACRGTAIVEMAPVSGNIDDWLTVCMEVAELPGTNTSVPRAIIQLGGEVVFTASQVGLKEMFVVLGASNIRLDPEIMGGVVGYILSQDPES